MPVGGGQSIVAGTKYVLVSSVGPNVKTSACGKSTPKQRRMTQPTIMTTRESADNTTLGRKGESAVSNIIHM